MHSCHIQHLPKIYWRSEEIYSLKENPKTEKRKKKNYKHSQFSLVMNQSGFKQSFKIQKEEAGARDKN